ncbi:MAG: alkaline phosphatase [Acidobacteriota bacterium]
MRTAPTRLWIMALVLLVPGLFACGGAGTDSGERPTAVVMIIGDGLGPAQIAYARRQALEVGERFAFESLPVIGMVSTYSASNAVTDSAAAATAFASGVKAVNGQLGIDPDGNHLKTISEQARENGWKIGYVTNTAITHATPAGFYAHVENRYLDADQIAVDLLEQAPDLALGGGFRDFVSPVDFGRRKDGRNLLDEAREQGYTVWNYDSDLGQRPPERLLGLFAGNHLGFELDRERLPESLRTPPLDQLASIALEALGRDGQSFFLLLEGGRIDHAGHDFDAAGVAAQVEAFDRAVQVVLDYQKEHPDTLILLTADHATGGLAVNDFVDWAAAERQQASIEWTVSSLQDAEDPAPAQDVRDWMGYEDLPEETLEEIRVIGDKYEAARALGNLLAERHGVTWVPKIDSFNTAGHTGDDVPLYAGGPGAESFSGALDNTEIPQRLGALLGWGAPNG